MPERERPQVDVARLIEEERDREKGREATVRLPPALQAELEESLEEADREEGVSWDELSRKLQKYD
jgi:hypothetical protein